MSEIDKWLSIKSATYELRLSASYVMHLLTTGKLKGVKTQLGWLIDPASVEQFRQEREAKLSTTAAK